MTKEYLSINSKVSQIVGNFNGLVNKVGDLAQLNTLVDSDLVGAINSVLDQGSVDSAAIVGILDSGDYLKLSDLPGASSGADVVLRTGSQTITGQKTFSVEPIFTANARVRKTDDAQIRLQATIRRDSSEVLTLNHDSSGSVLGWSDSSGVITFGIMSISNRSLTSPHPGRIDFYSGNNTLIGTVDSAVAPNISTTLLTKGKADLLYISSIAGSVLATNLATDAVTTIKIDDSAVTTAKLADGAVTAIKLASDAVTTSKILNANVTAAKLASQVTLIIYDSAGVAVKTLYGAGA